MAVRELFAALDRVEAILAGKRYLAGDQLTEADVRLYTTLVRFDKVYVGTFKVKGYMQWNPLQYRHVTEESDH